MNFLRITAIVLFLSVLSFRTEGQTETNSNYFIEYTIQTMNGDKTFKIETQDGFNANIIDSQNNELLIQFIDDDNDQRQINITTDGSLAEGTKTISSANFYSDSYKTQYKYHSDMVIKIVTVIDGDISGTLEGYCYDTNVSHNYKMKITGTFKLMHLK